MDTPVYHYILDRIENSDAHLETEAGLVLTIPASLLPTGAREGQVLTTSSGPDTVCEENVTFSINTQATEDRRNRTQELRSSLNRGPEGDLDL